MRVVLAGSTSGWWKFGACLVGAVLLCSCSLVGNLTTRPLPQHCGRMCVAGLHHEVEILRDAWGVPHLYARDAHDLFFAQGFTHAQDRWWQMDMFRRIGGGTLSELVGKPTIENDVYLRTLRLYDTAQKEVELLEAPARAMLEAFTEGVNAYILTRPYGELAMEYEALKLTGATVEICPWTLADSIVFGKIIQLQQCSPMVSETVYEHALDKVGAARLKYWVPPLPYGIKPTILSADDVGRLKSARTPNWVDELLRPPIGSNSWIASASISKTGRPILENDPHLAVSTPSLYYEIALHSSGNMTEAPIDAAGLAFTPVPAVPIGHNAAIAWGITIGKGVDQWDTYHIKVNPDRPLEQYEWNGQWVDFTVRQETFTISGEPDPVTVSVRETIHGPIHNDTLVEDAVGFHMEQDADPLAVRWAGLDPGGLGNALYQMMTAADWNDFHEALRSWDSPSCNFSYADVNGNIGYQLAAKVPLRAKDHTGFTPAAGWTDAYLWKGFVPFDDLPRMLNPERGLIVHTNQAAAPPEYFDWLAARLGADVNVYFQPTAYYGYRAERLDQLLEGKAPYGVDDFAAMQADVKLTSVDEIMPYLQALTLPDPALAEARDWLLAWDRRFNEESPQATLYALFWVHLLRNIYKDEVLTPQPNDGAMYAVRLLLEEPRNPWWDDVSTAGQVEDRDAILARSLADANDEAVSRWGTCRQDWEWGTHHTVQFVNLPLGMSGIGPIEFLVNRGPTSYPGFMETVNLGEWNYDTTAFQVQWDPSMRIVLNVGGWDNSLIIVAPGQSGHPLSRNYDDQVDLWRKVKHRKMLWSRARVLEETTDCLTLIPKG